MKVHLEETQVELMTLVNMASVAHQLSFSDYMEVGRMAQVVDGFVSLALEHLAGNDAEAAAGVLSEKRLVDLFRIGRSMAVKQGRLLKVLLAKAAKDGTTAGTTLLEPQFVEFIDGMVQRIPVLLDAQGKETFISSLEQLHAIRETIDALTQIVNIMHDHFHFTPDSLHDLTLLGTNQPDKSSILYTQLFCTAFVNDALGRPYTPATLSNDDCKQFADTLIQEEGAARLPEGSRAKFFAWLGNQVDTILPQTQKYFESLFAQMAGELRVFARSKDRDVRYLSTLIAKISY
jgi:hypothetical protein